MGPALIYPNAPQATEDLHKINTAVAFCYLWLFLTHKYCVYIFIHLVTRFICFCLCTFCHSFCFKWQLGKVYLTTKSHVHLQQENLSDSRWTYSHTRCSSWASSWSKTSISKQLVQSILAHTHSSRPYCIYVSVLYFVSPFCIDLIQLQSSNITKGHLSFTEFLHSNWIKGQI